MKWTAPANNNGSAVTGYVVIPVKAGVDQAPLRFDSAVTQQTITGLTSGASYTFKVEAINARGIGGPSAASTAITIQ